MLVRRFICVPKVKTELFAFICQFPGFTVVMKGTIFWILHARPRCPSLRQIESLLLDVPLGI